MFSAVGGNTRQELKQSSASTGCSSETSLNKASSDTNSFFHRVYFSAGETESHAF